MSAVTFSVPGPWSSIAEVQEANAALGQYWFSPDTMRFFSSRVESGIVAGRYFVSSEQQDDDYPRLYTVRAVDDQAGVVTVGDFQGYASLDEALRAVGSSVDLRAER